jgi:hypothetical protein
MARPRMVARIALALALCLLVPACVKSKVTRANFDKITNGMTMEEVEKVLGKGEKETGDGSNVAGQFGVAVTGTPTVGGGETYKWESSKATITVTFRQGKVVGKSEKGL